MDRVVDISDQKKNSQLRKKEKEKQATNQRVEIFKVFYCLFYKKV
jgi:hypothetical protein